MITYKEEVKVYFDKKLIGLIRQDDNGYFYTPKGSKERGDYFSTLAGCKYSLEG